MPSCNKKGPVQQMLNIIKHLDRDNFEPYLVTLYPEREDETMLAKYLPFVRHHFVPTKKVEMVMGYDKSLRKRLEEINPDVIHSLGVFPDFAVSRMMRWNQIITLRNYVYDDYPAKFGWVRGQIMARLHLYAMKHTSKTVTCSESLARIYREKLGLSFDFVRNGVDVEQYTIASEEERKNIRRELGLPSDAFIFVYTGQMIERKNVGFLLEAFVGHFNSADCHLLLLGGGTLLEGYKHVYGKYGNVDFRGNVNNVNHYLKACDAYVSTSKSEGLPNGVLEAMATGLPVVLSDIEQHIEIFEADQNIGKLYHQGNMDDLVQRMRDVKVDARDMGRAAYHAAHEYFSAKSMSDNYQKLYRQLEGTEQTA